MINSFSIPRIKSNIKIGFIEFENNIKSQEDEGKWLIANVFVNSKSFQGSIKASFRIDDFIRFRNGCKNISSGVCNDAIFSCDEEWMKIIIIKIDCLGHYAIKVNLKSEEECLSYKFMTDEFVIRELTDDVNSFVEKLLA